MVGWGWMTFGVFNSSSQLNYSNQNHNIKTKNPKAKGSSSPTFFEHRATESPPPRRKSSAPSPPALENIERKISRRSKKKRRSFIRNRDRSRDLNIQHNRSWMDITADITDILTIYYRLWDLPCASFPAPCACDPSCRQNPPRSERGSAE